MGVLHSLLVLALLTGCASNQLTPQQQQQVADQLKKPIYDATLKEAQQLVLDHILERSNNETEFKRHLDNRDYIFNGQKITNKLYQKEKIDAVGISIPLGGDNTAPGSFFKLWDVLSASEDEFVILGGKHIYRGKVDPSKKVKISVYKISKFDIQKANGSSGFNGFLEGIGLKSKKRSTVDLDKSLMNSTRDVQEEWSLYSQFKPKKSQELLKN